MDVRRNEEMPPEVQVVPVHCSRSDKLEERPIDEGDSKSLVPESHEPDGQHSRQGIGTAGQSPEREEKQSKGYDKEKLTLGLELCEKEGKQNEGLSLKAENDLGCVDAGLVCGKKTTDTKADQRLPNTVQSPRYAGANTDPGEEHPVSYPEGEDTATLEITPLPSLSRTRPIQQPAQPGAHSVAPGGRVQSNAPFDPDQLQQPEDISLPQLSGHTHLSSYAADDDDVSDADIESLAVANPVEDQQMPVADQMDGNDLETASSTSRQKSCSKSWIGFGFGLAVGLVVGVFAVVFRGTSSGENSTDMEEHGKLAAATRVEALLPNYSLRALYDPESPQSLAFDFVLQDPSLDNYPDWRVLQRFALAAYYHSTNGPQWDESDEWLSYTTHECNWWARPGYGFGSSERYVLEHPFPCEEDTNEKYRFIFHWSNNLQGSLPNELALLPELKGLSLYGNKLVGTFPHTLSNSTGLEAFNLEGNQFVGSLPDLTRLTNMQIIILQGNKMTGNLPSQVGLLSKLFFVQMDDNEFSGTLPTELGNLSSLWGFWISRNRLSGPIPSELGRNTLNNYLDLSRNNGISGAIPTELAWLPLHNLYLNYNELVGEIPSEFGMLTQLTKLELQHNVLTSSIPSELGEASAIWRLWMQHNQLSSEIPSQLGRLPLRTLDLADNPMLEGTLPEELAGITKELNVSGLSLVRGTVPQGLCEIQELDFDCSGSFCGCDCSCV